MDKKNPEFHTMEGALELDALNTGMSELSGACGCRGCQSERNVRKFADTLFFIPFHKPHTSIKFRIQIRIADALALTLYIPQFPFIADSPTCAMARGNQRDKARVSKLGQEHRNPWNMMLTLHRKRTKRKQVPRKRRTPSVIPDPKAIRRPFLCVLPSQETKTDMAMAPFSNRVQSFSVQKSSRQL